MLFLVDEWILVLYMLVGTAMGIFVLWAIIGSPARFMAARKLFHGFAYLVIQRDKRIKAYRPTARKMWAIKGHGLVLPNPESIYSWGGLPISFGYVLSGMTIDMRMPVIYEAAKEIGLDNYEKLHDAVYNLAYNLNKVPDHGTLIALPSFKDNKITLDLSVLYDDLSSIPSIIQLYEAQAQTLVAKPKSLSTNEQEILDSLLMKDAKTFTEVELKQIDALNKKAVQVEQDKQSLALIQSTVPALTALFHRLTESVQVKVQSWENMQNENLDASLMQTEVSAAKEEAEAEARNPLAGALKIVGYFSALGILILMVAMAARVLGVV